MPRDKLIGFLVSPKEKAEIQNRAIEFGFKDVSKYLRACEDYFSARRYNASKEIELGIITDCIKLLEEHKSDVQNSMLQQSLNKMGQNIKGDSGETSKTLKENTKNIKENIKGLEDQTLKENEENIKGPIEPVIEKNAEQFKAVEKTLIKLTRSKGRVPNSDFEYQAKRCGLSAEVLRNYYDSNYDFFVRESEKYPL